MKILVTGAGGPAAVCVIKDLIKRHEVIATDIDQLASGLYIAQSRFIVPKADDKNFIKRILEIAKEEDVSIIIPTTSEEMVYFAKSIDIFQRDNIIVLVPTLKSIETSMDKLATYKFFQGEEYCPKVYEKGEIVYPCVVKPRRSRGSRGFYICNSEKELEVALEKNSKNLGESVTMEYLEGEEYSVYGISDLDGKPLIAVPIKRILAVSESKKAQVIKDKIIIQVAADIASKLKLVGPWNVQIMNTSNGARIVEVNPRIGGTLSLIIAAGVNYVELAVKVFTKSRIHPKELEYEDKLFMTRYNEEIFIKPEMLTK